MSFFSELRRRNVVKVAVAYLAGAWLVAQVADLVLDNIGAPDWIIRAILLALFIGFPVALIFSWAYELTPEGLMRDTDLPQDAGPPPAVAKGSPLRQAVAWLAGLSTAAFLVAVFQFDVGGLRARLTHTPITSLAVLPLDNLSGDPEQQYFTEGMTEALIAELGQLGALQVISRTSSSLYRESEKSVPEIASELGVDALIEGSVLRADDDVRITLQLIDGRVDTPVFTRTFERKLIDVLALQASIAQAIADEIEISLEPATRSRLASTDPVNPEVYDLWLRGNYYLDPQSALNPELSQRALDAFKQAAELAPDYAPAYAGMAKAYLQLGGWWSHLPPGDYFPRALEAASKAVELDPTLADAHFVLGMVRHLYVWDWDGALTAFRSAMALESSDASNAFGMDGYANFLIAMGRYDEAIEIARRAVEIEPFAFWAHGEISWAQLMAGRHEEALATVKDTMELMPSNFQVNVLQEVVYRTEAGYEADARAFLPAVDQVRENFAIPTIAWLSYYYGRLGRQADTRALRDHLLARLAEGYVSAHMIALPHIALGESEEALHWITRGVDERDPQSVWLKEHYVYDSLRSEPRFQALLERMQFPKD